jgi:hypothetical protein
MTIASSLRPHPATFPDFHAYPESGDAFYDFYGTWIGETYYLAQVHPSGSDPGWGAPVIFNLTIFKYASTGDQTSAHYLGTWPVVAKAPSEALANLPSFLLMIRLNR